MNGRRLMSFLLVCSCLGGSIPLARAAGIPDEFQIKREAVFEFASAPAVVREGDRVTVTFESKGFCDATVAIEDAEGRIVRHLASGVLGKNAPAPFAKDSKKQTVVWDGKDDQGRYVDDVNAISVRVSLGLKPQFERSLFWSPHKRISECTPLFRAAPEGLYVYNGQAHDHVELFGHDGTYIRTVYPFPREKLKQVQGLAWHTFAETGAEAPLKNGYHQAGLLTGGTNNDTSTHEEGQGAWALDVTAGRVALANLKLNRLGADGSSGGLPLEGPDVTLPLTPGLWGGSGTESAKEQHIAPWSVAFSPDGKRLYMAGYAWTFWFTSKWDCYNVVQVMDYEKNDAPRVFAGGPNPADAGNGPNQFHCATSVACDAQGRVYVSDYMNDRIQVFAPDAKLLKSIPVAKPALVRVHQKTGALYVFSWPVHNVEMTKANNWQQIKPKVTLLGSFDDPKNLGEYPLPLPLHANWWAKHPPGPMYCAEVDSWTEPPTILIASMRGNAVERGMGGGGDGFGNYGTWEQAGVRGFVVKDGKLAPSLDFGKATAEEVVRAAPAILSRQRLYVNPATGKLYVGEGDSGVMKSVNQLVEIDPNNGKIGLVDLPLGAEDLCFDLGGMVYLRTDTVVARYDARTWREVPWDYGEEQENHSWGMGAKGANLLGGLVTPGHRSFSFWHQGGMDINAKGHLIVATCSGDGKNGLDGMLPVDLVLGQGARRDQYAQGKQYRPQIYPGRMLWGEIHVWDKHGTVVAEDAVPGMGHLNGIAIDRDDNIYMLAAARRLIEGKNIDPGLARDVSGTVVKVAPKKAKVLSTGNGVAVPLPDDAKPKRPLDMVGFTTGWIEGAEWLYGGVGFSTPGGCICWNTRFDVDEFARTFAPEPLIYAVSVLDASGNLILRVGQYGNADDGRPLVADGGPKETHAIGGDETALMHPCYVASHTDHRLFIADAGNGRIASVKLGYHAEKKIALKDVKE